MNIMKKNFEYYTYLKKKQNYMRYIFKNMI